MRFEWDEEKAAANLAKHGVSFAEASTVFGDPLAWSYPDSDHSEFEERQITIGTSSVNRLLVIAHSEVSMDSIRIISAREATRRERLFYEEG